MRQPSRSEDDMRVDDRPYGQEAVEEDPVPGLDGRWREPDPETCAFQEPGQPPRTYWRGPNL